MRSIPVLLMSVLLLSATGCAHQTAGPAAADSSPTRITRSATAGSAPAAGQVVPWNPAGMRAVTDTAPPSTEIATSSRLAECDGKAFRLLPGSARTAPATQLWRTTFVLQFTGSAPCSMSRGFFGVTMTSADGTVIPVDSMPAGPPQGSIAVTAHQLVFGVVSWAVSPRRSDSYPERLTLIVGHGAFTPPLTIAVPDLRGRSTPAQQDAENSTAYGQWEATIDPGTLASLTVEVTVAPTVSVPKTLQYTVALTNPTTEAVPLTDCPQFVEQLAVVPLKVATAVGARGPLNCADLPPAIGANSSVTMQMQLDTSGQIPGPGALTWQLLDHGRAATESIAEVTVQQQ